MDKYHEKGKDREETVEEGDTASFLTRGIQGSHF